MEHNENLRFYSRPVFDLATAIDRWLAARTEYKKQASDENQYAYNLSYFALGEAWAQRCPETASIPGAFEQFRRGLITQEAE